MNAREGDPILSADGKEIVAYWACDLAMQMGDYFTFAVMSNMAEADSFARASAEDSIAQPPMASISVQFHAPDRTYWRIAKDSAKEWDRSKWFRRASAAVGPDPKGMVTAYELVIGDHGMIDPMIKHVLEHKLEYWKWRSEK